MADDFSDKQPPTTRVSPGRGHEPDTTSVRAVGIFFIALVVSLIVVAVAIHILFGAFVFRAQETDPPLSPFAPSRQGPPAPRLQVDYAAERRALHQQQVRVLTTYGWVDRQRNIVHVPIEYAMDLYVQQASQPRRVRARQAAESAPQGDAQAPPLQGERGVQP